MKQHIIGSYEMGALIGTGTVGLAYRARHRETGQHAVVKLLQVETAQVPDIQRRFVREVAISEKLHHPNIVRHYDCGLHEDQIYFAMELVDSGTLKEELKRRCPLPWREAVGIAIQICAALDHAHQFDIIHRDLKPANLFLSTDGTVKVGDFGLARDLNCSRLTMEGQTVGTCRYMAPEQIAGVADLTGAADLYALGCVLFEMLVGRPPFDGTTVIEIFEAHLYELPASPKDQASECPHDLSELVLRLLAKEPEDRPAGAIEVQLALTEIRYGRPMKHTVREKKRGTTATTTGLAAHSLQPNSMKQFQTKEGMRLPLLAKVFSWLSSWRSQ